MKIDKKCLVCDFVDALYSIYDHHTFEDSDVTEEEYKLAKHDFLKLFKKLVVLVNRKDFEDNLNLLKRSIYEKDPYEAQ